MIETYKIVTGKYQPCVAPTLHQGNAGPYKPRTGRTGHTGRTGGFVNHAPAILATLALIYSTHRLLVVRLIVVHFHLCSLLDSYTALEVCKNQI